MGMQKSEMANDPLVQETIKVFHDVIAERYKDSPGFKPEAFDPENCENPALDVLVETDSLDSLSAAVIAAETVAGWVDVSDVASKLNKEVADTLKVIHSEEMILDADALIKSGNKTALKLSVATVAAICTGEEFMEMRAQAGSAELKMAVAQMSALVTDMADRLTEDKAWAALPPKLLDRYLEGLGNLADLQGGRVQKRVMNEIVQQLKTEMARVTAEEIVEVTPPQIDPNSKFEQLKYKARNFKP